MIKPNFYIIRGLPGSGKTTYGNRLGCYCLNPNDQYSIVSGKYYFDDAFSKPAELLALSLCKMIMTHKKDIAVCEVFLLIEDMINYIKKADQYNYNLIVVDCICSLQESMNSNKHDVPSGKLKHMYDNFYDFPALVDHCGNEKYKNLINNFDYEYIALSIKKNNP
jgi:tRNA uridine 5-carbamoylmethylation protein Kti12